MKVFISGTSFKPEYGGPAVSVPNLAEHLGKRGIEIAIWAPDGSAGLAKQGYFRTTSSSVSICDGDLETALRVFGIPDIIHDNGIWLPHNHKVAEVAKKLGVPRVVTVRGMLEPWAVRYRPLKKSIAWRLYQKADLQSASILHATSEAEKQHIAGRGLTRPIRVIPNGVSMPDEVCREQPNDNTDQPTALFLGRLHPKKGIPMLIDAWSELSTGAWHLRIVGPAENGYDTELMKKVAELGLLQSVSFDGPKYGREKAREYLAAQLFILPTYSENFGISVAEAMSYAIPVITTTGAPWSVIAEKDAGWYVEPTKGALKMALSSALALKSNELKAKGINGRQIVQSEYSWTGIAAAMQDLYEEAINNHKCD